MLGAADKAVPTTYVLLSPELCDNKHAQRKFYRCVNMSFPVGLTPIILPKTRAASKSCWKPSYTKYGCIGDSCMMVLLVVTALWARSGYEYPAPICVMAVDNCVSLMTATKFVLINEVVRQIGWGGPRSIFPYPCTGVTFCSLGVLWLRWGLTLFP